MTVRAEEHAVESMPPVLAGRNHESIR
jgi:hypothetical protein